MVVQQGRSIDLLKQIPPTLAFKCRRDRAKLDSNDDAAMNSHRPGHGVKLNWPKDQRKDTLMSQKGLRLGDTNFRGKESLCPIYLDIGLMDSLIEGDSLPALENLRTGGQENPMFLDELILQNRETRGSLRRKADIHGSYG
jgi:hypothetical protein